METPPKPTVLFLEDDADTRALVKFSLEQAGINVISAETVDEAWLTAMEAWTTPTLHDIDLFLLDGLIPHGDSLKLCADLRKIEPETPIVFYSGLAYKEDILKGLEAGATGYLVKPFSGDLAEEILRYIHGGKSRESVEPLFMDKEYMPEIAGKVRESGREGSAQISEFGTSIDRAGNIEKFDTKPAC
jgi:DNA-binding response OmpR family regulator